MKQKITIKSNEFEGIKSGWDSFNEELYLELCFEKKIKPTPEYLRQLKLIVQNKFKSN